MTYRSAYICLFVILLAGCGLAVEDKITGNYFLTAADDDDDTGLSYHAPSDGPIYALIIVGTVFAVGYNKEYLIAKQHPKSDSGINRRITNYYILPLKDTMNWRTMNGLIGPLSFDQFNQKKIDLRISPSLTFTIEKSSLK